ncbi:hypothetical protein ACTHOQ_18345 [Solibacillus silvestris]|uniref:hypothetical protein n=1 Tax=Solibacillus silvestris TaxID=76853 RepID=UPI003F7FA621
MFLIGKYCVISSGHFNTKNNKTMSVLNVQVNGDIHKFFGSGKIPKFNFGEVIGFLVVAQRKQGQEYSFYLAKAEGIKQDTEK